MQLFRVCRTAARPWDASRVSNFFFICMLIVVTVTLAPLTYFFARARASGECGPYGTYTGGAYLVYESYLALAPETLRAIVFWITYPIVLLGTTMLLCIRLI